MPNSYDNLLEEFSPEMIAGFMNEFHEAYGHFGTLLIQLEVEPDNQPLLDDLFRRVHSIKSNLRMVGLDAIAAYVHTIEDILDALRSRTLTFDKRMGDLLLLAMERVQGMAEAAFHRGNPADEVGERIARRLARIGQGDSGLVAETIALLDPEHGAASPESLRNRDLHFFASLARVLEFRSPYWTGRSERMVDLCKAMNAEAGFPVTPVQLEVAVYLHDIGMAFLPFELLHKPASLHKNEQMLVHAHAGTAAQLISANDNWLEAALIVGQHHERADGSGYPDGLSEEEISPGAAILAIVDTFEAVTHERAVHHARPVLRAIYEINNACGTHFVPYWVDIFNRVIRLKPVRKTKSVGDVP